MSISIDYCNNIKKIITNDKHSLRDIQKQVIDAICDPKQRALNVMTVRQSGRTDAIVLSCLFLLDNYPNIRIGIITPYQQQSEMIIERILLYKIKLLNHINNKILTSFSNCQINNHNGSSITAMSEKQYLTNKSIYDDLNFDVIIVDCAQCVSEEIFNNIFEPMGTICNAKIILLGSGGNKNCLLDKRINSPNTYTIKENWLECEKINNCSTTLIDCSNIERVVQTYILGLAPKEIKQQLFPNNPEIWTDGDMDIKTFKKEYMLEFID